MTQLSITDLAASLGCSEGAVRRNPELMGMRRELPAIGKRWDAEEVREWVLTHQQQDARPGSELTIIEEFSPASRQALEAETRAHEARNQQTKTEKARVG